MDIIVFTLLGYLLHKILKNGNSISPYVGIYITLVISTGMMSALFYILAVGLPAPEHLTNKSIPSIPFVNSLIIIATLALLIVKKQKPIVGPHTSSSSKLSWLLFLLPAFSFAISKYSFLLAVYSPKIYMSDVRVPGIGVVIYILGTVVSASTLHFFSRLKNSKNPELFFWVTLIASMYGIYQTTYFTLILVYGLLAEYGVSYAYWASIMTIGYMPFTFSIFAMAFRNDSPY